MMTKKVSAKKDLKEWVHQTLVLSMDRLREGMNDKDFNKAVKQATRSLTEPFHFKKVKPASTQTDKTESKKKKVKKENKKSPKSQPAEPSKDN